MKKLITLGLVSALSVLVFVGCGGAGASAPSSHDAKTAESTFFTKHLTQEKAHKLILSAGEEAGWKMTEFKSNSVIAEKIDGEDTISVTISFDNDSFEIHPENSDLEDAIVDAQKSSDSKGH